MNGIKFVLKLKLQEKTFEDRIKNKQMQIYIGKNNKCKFTISRNQRN